MHNNLSQRYSNYRERRPSYINSKEAQIIQRRYYEKGIF